MKRTLVFEVEENCVPDLQQKIQDAIDADPNIGLLHMTTLERIGDAVMGVLMKESTPSGKKKLAS